jgi:hypothetical protein
MNQIVLMNFKFECVLFMLLREYIRPICSALIGGNTIHTDKWRGGFFENVIT